MDQDTKQIQLRDLQEFREHRGQKICQDLSEQWLAQKNRELQTHLRQHRLDEAFKVQALIDGFITKDLIIDDYIESLTNPETENPVY